jgi:hypothetical protein
MPPGTIADINSFPARQRDSCQHARAPRGEFEHFHSPSSRIAFFDAFFDVFFD